MKKYLNYVNPKNCALTLIISIFFTFLIATGPTLQTYTLALLNSQTSTIYGSAHDQDIVRFDTLSTWLSNSLYWQFVVMGICISWLSTRTAHARKTAISITIAVTLIITLFDIALTTATNPLTLKYFFENLFSNFFGGVFIALITIIFFGIADIAYKNLHASEFTRQIATHLIIASIGILLSILIYYACALFFQLQPSRFDIILGPGTEGRIITSSESANSKNTDGFSITPQTTRQGNFSWIMPRGGFEMTSSSKNDQKSKIEIFFASGCTSPEETKKLLEKNPNPALIANSSDSKFKIVGDMGPTDLWSFQDEKEQTSIIPKTSNTSLFYIQSDEKEKEKIQITQYTGDPSILSITGNEILNIFIGIPLMKIHEDEIKKLSPRMLTIQTSDFKKHIRFWPQPTNIESQSECRVIFDKKINATENSETDIQDSGNIISTIVRTIPYIDKRDFSRSTSSFQISGNNGWLSQREITPETLSGNLDSSIESIQARGEISELYIDDNQIKTRPTETYTAQGKFQADFRKGNLRIAGSAKYVWRDQRRFTLTRWEKLNWEIKLALTTAFISILGLGWAYATRLLTNDYNFTWIKK